MAFAVIYFLIILIYGLWIVGLMTRNIIISLMASLCMFPLAIYIFANGVDIFRNFLTQMFAAATFTIGGYTSFQAALELIDNG